MSFTGTSQCGDVTNTGPSRTGSNATNARSRDIQVIIAKRLLSGLREGRVHLGRSDSLQTADFTQSDREKETGGLIERRKGRGVSKTELSHLKIQIYQRLKRTLILIRRCETVHIFHCKHFLRVKKLAFFSFLSYIHFYC